MNVSVFVPVYNEGPELKTRMGILAKCLKKIAGSYEIFVIDDGSNSSRAMKIHAPHFKYIRYECGPSRRENLAASFRYAKNPIIAFIDADMSTDMSYIPDLLGRIRNGADIAIGSRYMGIKSKRGLMRYFISKIYNTFMGVLFGSVITDHQCGFKAFRRDVLLSIVKEMGYDKSLTRGWFWDAEMLVRAQNRGYKIEEFPVRWESGKKSTFNPIREIRMIPYIIRFKMRYPHY